MEPEILGTTDILNRVKIRNKKFPVNSFINNILIRSLQKICYMNIRIF